MLAMPAQDVFDFLSGLCNEPYINVTSVWESSSPDVGICLERTLLLWVPCAFLWLTAPFYYLYGRRQPYDPLPWTALGYTKLVVTLVLVVAALVELVWAVVQGRKVIPPAEFMAPVILFITYVLHLGLAEQCRRRGERSSGLLCVAWLLLCVACLPQLYTSIISLMHSSEQLPKVLIGTFLVQYLGYLTLFLCYCVCDAPSKRQLLSRSGKPCPKLDASCLSRIMFFWNIPMVWRGWRRPLVAEDLWDVLPENQALYLHNKWQDTFTSKRDEKINSKLPEEHIKLNPLPLVRKNVAGSSISQRLAKIFCWDVLISFLLLLTAEGIRLTSPIILGWLIGFISDLSEPSWHGYVYAVGLFAAIEVASLFRNSHISQVLYLSARIRSVIMTVVYEKALKLTAAARRQSTIGHIVNLMAVDAMSIGTLMVHLIPLITGPLTIMVALALVWQRLGPSALAGVFLLLISVPLQTYLLNKCKCIEQHIMKEKDKRMKHVSELISGIKVLKLYAWEGSFADQVQELRNVELHFLSRMMMLQSSNYLCYYIMPIMVTLVTFTTYLLVSEDKTLSTEDAFVSVALFNIMRAPLIQMPEVFSQAVQAYVAMQRVEKYMAREELDPQAVITDASEPSAVVVRDGQFHWDIDEDQAPWGLKDIDLDVPKGHLVAVVGSVGAGKSSLLSAILGEMKKERGKVVVNGTIAYVSQQAWLQNATIQENIIWGNRFDRYRYREVVRACALLPDLEMFPGGDRTEVGEQGINISGGQKQRLALARAAYSEADILLLDDPLSAVDAHVGRHIFDKVIGPYGILKNKTRVLVTHSLTFLPHVDKVVVVRDGQMVQEGSYHALLASEGDFSRLITQHFNTENNEVELEELDEICHHLENTGAGGNLFQQLSARRSSIQSTASVSLTSDQQFSSTDCVSDPEHNIPNSTSPATHMQESRAARRSSQKESTFSRSHSVCSEDSVFLKDEENNMKLVKEEEVATGKVARHIYLTYWRAMGLQFAFTPFLCSLLGQTCYMLSNVWLSQWSSTQDTSRNTTEQVDHKTFLIFYGAFGCGQALFLFLSMLLLVFGGVRAARVLHHRLLSSVVHLPMSFFDTNPNGRIINRFSRDINAIDKQLVNNFRAFNSIMSQMITSVVVIVVSLPLIMAFLLPILLFYVLIQHVFVTTSRQLQRLESVSVSPIYSHFSESLQGGSTIRAFSKEKDFFHDSLHKIENSLKAIYGNIFVNRWLGVHLELMSSTITFLVAIIGVLQRDNISPGLLALSITFSLSISYIFNFIVRVVSAIEANIVSVERVNHYIQETKEADWEIKEHQPPNTWPEAGDICFKNYETRYRPGLDLVIKGINCSIKPAEKVGIVGRTGAGKSSMLLALFRIIEAAGGDIVIDGVNISKIGLHDLRSKISIIPQDPVLFSGTLRMNLDPLGEKSDEEMWRVLELAHLKNYIQEQPKGLEHTVEEDAANFSVGQRQLVCLARALLRHSQVLVLDEATAAVDLDTDNLIQETIRSQFTQCTVLTIAHRINTIMDSDKVMVMHQGQIAEFDTPKVLLQNTESIFYGMAKDAGAI